MNLELDFGEAKMNIKRWAEFSLDEKKREFEELTHSSYWWHLPGKTQKRVLALLETGEDSEKC